MSRLTSVLQDLDCRAGLGLGKVNRPTMFFYLAVATSRGEAEGLVHQKLKYFHET